KVAAAVGVSGRTYDKMKAVVDAALADPEKYGDLPFQMDETGKVQPAYQEMKRRRAALAEEQQQEGEGPNGQAGESPTSAQAPVPTAASAGDAGAAGPDTPPTAAAPMGDVTLEAPGDDALATVRRDVRKFYDRARNLKPRRARQGGDPRG